MPNSIFYHQLERNEHYTRMMECANESLLQRCNLIEKESDMLRTEFSRTIIEMQRKATMRRMVSELKGQALQTEGDLLLAINNNIKFSESQGRDFVQEFMNEEKEEMIEIKQDISDGATEFRNTLSNLHEAYNAASIHLDEIGFPVKPTGAKARPKVEKARQYGQHKRLSSIRHRGSSMHMSTVSLGSSSGHGAHGSSSGHGGHGSRPDFSSQLAVDLANSPAGDPHHTSSKFEFSKSHIGHQSQVASRAKLEQPSVPEPSTESKARVASPGSSEGTKTPKLPHHVHKKERGRRLSGPEVVRRISNIVDTKSVNFKSGDGEGWKAAMQAEIQKQMVAQGDSTGVGVSGTSRRGSIKSLPPEQSSGTRKPSLTKSATVDVPAASRKSSMKK